MSYHEKVLNRMNEADWVTVEEGGYRYPAAHIFEDKSQARLEVDANGVIKFNNIKVPLTEDEVKDILSKVNQAIESYEERKKQKQKQKEQEILDQL